MNLKKLLENHKVWLVVGGLATAAGLVIAWKSYQAQQQGNQAAQDSSSQQSDEDSLLNSLLQTPLAGSSENGSGSSASTDTGNSDFQELLALLLSSGNSSGSTDTGSGGSTSSGSTDTGNGGSTSGGSTGTAPPVSSPISKPVSSVPLGSTGVQLTGGPSKPTNTGLKLFTSTGV